MSAVLFTSLAYLLGSFPSALVVGYLATGRDVRKYGSGNVGAANVSRIAGLRVGIVVATLDILKGVIPILVGRGMGLGPVALAVIALAAVVGHDFSLYIGFRGGKGVATTLGVAFALGPVAGVLAAITWLVVLWWSHYSSLASLSALLLLPLYMALTHQPAVYVTMTFILYLLALLKHYDNVIRLLRGTEQGFGTPMPDDR